MLRALSYDMIQISVILNSKAVEKIIKFLLLSEREDILEVVLVIPAVRNDCLVCTPWRV